MLQGHVHDVAAHGDRCASKDRVHMDGAVIAHIFAIGPFGLAIAALVEITLDDDLRIGGHEDIVGEAFHEGRGLPAQGRDHMMLVALLARGGGEKIEGMAAEREAHGQTLAALHAALVDALEIGGRGDIGARLGAVAQGEATAAHIGAPGHGIDHIIDARTDVAAAIEPMLGIEGQFAEINVLAGDLHRMDGRLIGGNLHGGHGGRDARQQLFVDGLRGGVEGDHQALTAGGDLGGELHPLRPRLSEEHGLGGFLDDGGHRCESHGLVVNLHVIAGDQLINEAAQPIFFEVEFLAQLAGPAHLFCLRPFFQKSLRQRGSHFFHQFRRRRKALVHDLADAFA